MSKPSHRSKNDGRRFIVMALVGLLLLVVAMPSYHMFGSWSRYQQQRQGIITIRKGRKHPTLFEFQGPRNERNKIPAWRPFAEDLAGRVKRIRIHLAPNNNVQFEKLSHFDHLQELELTIETPFRLELPAELAGLSNVTAQQRVLAAEVGFLDVSDPSKVHVLALASEDPPHFQIRCTFRSAALSDPLHFRWRIYLPDNHSVTWRTSKLGGPQRWSSSIQSSSSSCSPSYLRRTQCPIS